MAAMRNKTLIHGCEVQRIDFDDSHQQGVDKLEQIREFIDQFTEIY